MIINISGRHLEITPAIRQHAEDKANKLPKFYDLIQSIEVILDGSDGKKKRCEVIVDAEHQDKFVAHHEGDDLYACIDQAMHKVQLQLSAHKDKHRNRKHSA